MSLNTAAITAGIAALSVSGVTIKDMSAIPDEVLGRDCPIMFPEPQELSGTGDNEQLTFGGSSAYWSPIRTLVYTYLHDVAGFGRAIKDFYAPMAAKQDLIFEAVVEMNVSGVDVLSVNFSRMGTLESPTGAQFYGFMMTIALREKVNA